MNECLMTPQHEKQIGYWVSEKGKYMKWLSFNTFYLWLYGIRHMVKYHSDSERGNPLPPHGLLFPIYSKGSPTDRIAHTTAFDTPVVKHWL